jgi:hypothetical protein
VWQIESLFTLGTGSGEVKVGAPVVVPPGATMTASGQPAPPPSAAALANGLPPLWDVRKDRTGRIYYINHVTKSTQWNDPRPLPDGWERKFDEGRKLPYFVNHRV